MQAHQGAVVKLVWAPSEYGDVLACCSPDGEISVWEEIEESTSPSVPPFFCVSNNAFQILMFTAILLLLSYSTVSVGNPRESYIC